MLSSERPAFVLAFPDIIADLIHCFSETLVACVGEVDEQTRNLPDQIVT